MTATVTALRDTSVTPGMHIADIKIPQPRRANLGSIGALAESINREGLLCDIGVLTDGTLVTGERRLSACLRLAWTSVPVRYVRSLTDAAELLRTEAEAAELLSPGDPALLRKPMLPSELAAFGEVLFAMESAVAQRRARRHGGTAPGRKADTGGTGAKTRDLVAPLLGMGARSYMDLRFVYRVTLDSDAPPAERELARETMAEIDAGAGVCNASDRLRERLRILREQALHDGPPVPAVQDKSREGVARRWEQITELAGSGHSAEQVAALVGMSVDGLRVQAAKRGVVFTADRVLHRKRRPESNRIMTDVTAGIAGMIAGLELVNIADLDQDRARSWADSLATSNKTLIQFIRLLKESAQ